LTAAALMVGTTLACGGGDEGDTPTLTWYILTHGRGASSPTLTPA